MPSREETIHASLGRLSSPSFLHVTNPRLQACLNDVHDAIAQVKSEFRTLETKKKNGEIRNPEDNADYDRYADKLAEGLPKIENGVIDIVQAFESGDPLTEAESVLNLCGSLVSTIGAMAGPEGALVGGLLGALFGMISAILKLFGPPPIPLIDQIKTLLQEEEAKAQYQQLRVALVGFQSLEDAWEQELWPVVNLQNGPEVQQLRAADEWLIEPDNQAPEIWAKWAKVLDMQCKVFIAAVKAVPLALKALDKQTGMSPYEKQNAGGLLTVGIRTLAKNQLAFLEDVASVVQKHGIYWILGTNNEVYFSKDQFQKDSNEVNGDRKSHLSVVATMAELQKTSPNLQVFGLNSDGSVWQSTMQWPSGPVVWTEIPNSPLAHDVCGIADDKGQIFYWLGFPALVSCVSLATNTEVDQFSIDSSYTVKSVRAVFGPKSIEDDPDENPANPRVLDGVTQAVYVGIENNKNICVYANTPGSPKNSVVLAPDNYFGIAADRRFLWVFTQQNIYRASHTSVLRSLGRSPRWESVAPGDNYLTGAVSEDHSLFLWSTSDNTLTFAGYGTKYWTPDTLLDLGTSNKTALLVQKLPNYRWFLMGGLMESLRLQVRKPDGSKSQLVVGA